ncbi:protocadherin-12 isoform X2 [Betta splendens]|uniref:Protocadherin-12 isoform X2 n=1 Tax=Betta splendens TaxID=158456 RepID=A0A6P7NM09_BETSP|nr:protocadherin-12 isoform X2 [Betta splendens]
MRLVLLLALSVCYEARSYEPSSVTIQYRVWEEQPAGTQVGRLVDDLRQRDEGGALDNFQVVEHGKAHPFSVSSRDGIVSTQGRLDREELCRGSDPCEVAFNVLYRKSGAVNWLTVHVEVMDINDHSPTFPSPLQEVEISESASLRMRFPLDWAVDPDAGPNDVQAYELSANQHFALDVTVAHYGTKQVELVVIKELDREVQASFELTLVAWDKGTPPKSGSTMVHVNILDSNDNSPTFEDSTPTVEIPEDTARGTVIINLKATDPDQGANGEVEYSIISKRSTHSDQETFIVDPQGGAVSLNASLNYETQMSYEVIIQARDRGPNSIPSHCKLHIKLMDVNDNAPRIHVTWTSPSSPVATVLEGAQPDTFVALVTVSDADSGENGRTRADLVEGSGLFRLKRIHDSNYMIVTNGSLDREKVMQYNMTVRAQDYGEPSLSCIKHLPVHVLDENDNAPMFSTSLYKTSFKENNIAGYHALKVEALDLDLDLSGRVSYYIQNSNDLEKSSDLVTNMQSFSIHPSSGVISIQRPLDYEESHTYSFVVEAIDHGHPPLSSTATVQVNIEDVNDNTPQITEPKPRKGVASLNVPVNADKGEIVTELGNDMEETSTTLPINHLVRGGHGFFASTIKAEDPDSGLNGELQYLITDGNPDGLFWLDQTTGQLFINTTNATELIGKTFPIDISVCDKGTPSLAARMTLEVTFINLRDHLKNSSPGNRGQLSFTMMMAICLGATCLLLLLAIATVTTFCRPQKRDNRAYNCRQAESTYTRHPRRPQKNIRKSDIQLVPVIRGRKDDSSEDDGEAKPLAPSPLMSEEQMEGQYTLTPSIMNTSFHSQGYPEAEATTPQCRTLRKPGNIELDGAVALTPATSYRTLRTPRNLSSSSSASHSSTLKRQAHGEGDVSEVPSGSQATLRRTKNLEARGAQEAAHRQMLQNLVRLSMAAFGDSIELSSASPEVQISQLLSLLRQGQLQPRTNFRGNKYSHRSGRCGGQDSDWQSTKDSGHGESEAGDMDWEPGRDSPIDTQPEEGLSNMGHADEVFYAGGPAWGSRLSLPLVGDYHHNVFVPNEPPSAESELLPRHGLDSSSFSTFGKSPEKEAALGGALLSEVSTLFEMLLTQKADAHPGPRPDVLYRLSAAYRRSLGLDGSTGPGATRPRRAERRPGLDAAPGPHQ